MRVLKGLNHFEKQIVMEIIYKHVEYLSVNIGDRHLWKDYSLDKAADYIESAFMSYGYIVWRQIYSCYGKSVSNLIVEKTGKTKRSLSLAPIMIPYPEHRGQTIMPRL